MSECGWIWANMIQRKFKYSEGCITISMRNLPSREVIFPENQVDKPKDSAGNQVWLGRCVRTSPSYQICSRIDRRDVKCDEALSVAYAKYVLRTNIIFPCFTPRLPDDLVQLALSTSLFSRPFSQLIGTDRSIR